MPYISQEARDKFIRQECGGMQTINDIDEIIELAKKIENCGELNYVITVIAQAYIKQKVLRYQNINDVIGALEGAKMELYRRVASSYEDEKIKENGDVNVIDD